MNKVQDSPKPVEAYGVTQRTIITAQTGGAVENIRRNGYTVVNSDFPKTKIDKLAVAFDSIHAKYLKAHGKKYLKEINEHNMVRLPMTFDIPNLVDLALHPKINEIINELIDGIYILNQQNLICNPSEQTYNQARWHRDIPYQHFVSSTPLAINAIYCVDDFKSDNGASFVLPFSHKFGPLPSDAYVDKNALQITAPAGSFIILDCMTFHRGGFNRSKQNRRAINQVFTIPYFKQQISIPNMISSRGLDQQAQRILGFGMEESQTVENYLNSALSKQRARETQS